MELNNINIVSHKDRVKGKKRQQNEAPYLKEEEEEENKISTD